jgi:glutamyl-tRNA reductase
LAEAVAAADVIVAGTGADRTLLTRSLVEQARGPRSPCTSSTSACPATSIRRGRTRRCQPVESRRSARLGRSGLSHRAAEAERVRSIVAQEVENHLLESTARQAAPLVASMHEAADRVRARELERFASRLGDLDDRQRDSIEALTKASSPSCCTSRRCD